MNGTRRWTTRRKKRSILEGAVGHFTLDSSFGISFYFFHLFPHPQPSAQKKSEKANQPKKSFPLISFISISCLGSFSFRMPCEAKLSAHLVVLFSFASRLSLAISRCRYSTTTQRSFASVATWVGRYRRRDASALLVS